MAKKKDSRLSRKSRLSTHSRNSRVNKSRKHSRKRVSRQKRGDCRPMYGGIKLENILLDRYQTFRQSEDQLYRDLATGKIGKGVRNNGSAKLKKSCSDASSVRCSVDSIAPGICVPLEDMCYEKSLRFKYMSNNPLYKDVRNAIQSLGSEYPEFVKASTGQQLSDKELRQMMDKYIFQIGRRPIPRSSLPK